jgi:2-hydroxychromene-2-carboxylate isomerase
MSIRTLLMPVISQHLLARERLLKLRARAERERLAGARTHQVHYFHQVDDPYSALVAGILPQLIARYDIDVVPHVVGPPPDSAAPEREKLIAYSRKDARLLARHWNLVFDDLMGQPQDQSVEVATRLLVAAVQDGTFIEAAGEISTCLWSDPPSLYSMGRSGGPLRAVDPSAVSSHVAASDALRQQLGHYLGATLLLCRRVVLGHRPAAPPGEAPAGPRRATASARRASCSARRRSEATPVALPPAADRFLRLAAQPYSAIVAPRVFELGRLHRQRRCGCATSCRWSCAACPCRARSALHQPRCRPRGHLRRVPFGCSTTRSADPPSAACTDAAGRARRGGARPICCRSCKASGPKASTPAVTGAAAHRRTRRAGLGPMRRPHCATTAGAPWPRPTAKKCSLWAVGRPSFRVGDTAVWGQDRLWAVQEALLDGKADRPTLPGTQTMILALKALCLAGLCPGTGRPRRPAAAGSFTGTMPYDRASVAARDPCAGARRHVKVTCACTAARWRSASLLTLLFGLLHWKPLADAKAARGPPGVDVTMRNDTPRRGGTLAVWACSHCALAAPAASPATPEHRDPGRRRLGLHRCRRVRR